MPESSAAAWSPKRNASQAIIRSSAIHLALPRSAHSHIVRRRHPSSASWSEARASRVTFAAIFATQNSALVFGLTDIGQSCPCQKQPFTKITAPYRGNTRSGRPGRSGTWTRKRYPRRWRPRRTWSSGFVSRPRMLCMLKRRTAGACTSARTGRSLMGTQRETEQLAQRPVRVLLGTGRRAPRTPHRQLR